MEQIEKMLVWLGSSQKDFNCFPEEIRVSANFALLKAKEGGKAIHAKPLKGFGGATVLEIVDSDKDATYRVVYTVKFFGVVFVLHAFQKKSKSGIATPKQEIDMVARRLKLAEKIYREELKKIIKNKLQQSGKKL